MPQTDLIQLHFPALTPHQKEQFAQLKTLYITWNEKLNLISRKDIANLTLHHLLHSLSIAKIVTFQPGADILDLGTGGGLPGLPLAILFPATNFVLIDATKKKIDAVAQLAKALKLHNVKTHHIRAEDHMGRYDFVLGRGVTQLPQFYQWSKKKTEIQAPARNTQRDSLFERRRLYPRAPKRTLEVSDLSYSHIFSLSLLPHQENCTPLQKAHPFTPC